MDTVPKEIRRKIMSAVKSRDTNPEMLVRSKLFSEGFRYRIHKRDLPGTPDIVLPRYRTIIFVHGCFWHGHDCRQGRQIPKTRTQFWKAKFERNVERDRVNQRALRLAGWTVFVIWTCQLESETQTLLAYLNKKRNILK